MELITTAVSGSPAIATAVGNTFPGKSREKQTSIILRKICSPFLLYSKSADVLESSSANDSSFASRQARNHLSSFDFLVGCSSECDHKVSQFAVWLAANQGARSGLRRDLGLVAIHSADNQTDTQYSKKRYTKERDFRYPASSFCLGSASFELFATGIVTESDSVAQFLRHEGRTKTVSTVREDFLFRWQNLFCR